LKSNFEIQYFFNTFHTAWEPCTVAGVLFHEAVERTHLGG